MQRAFIKINGAKNVKIIGNSIHSDTPVTLVEGTGEDITVQDNHLLAGNVGLACELSHGMSPRERKALVEALRVIPEKYRIGAVRKGRWEKYFKTVADAALPEIFRKLLGN